MEFDQVVAELEQLVDALEREGDEHGLRLLQLIDAVHRPGLAALAVGAVDDPYAQALLAMYGLVPLDDWAQAAAALDEVRPYIESHGGSLELLEVDGGTVHVRLGGSCHGCSGSTMTLKRGLEATLRERFDGFRELVAHDVEAPEPLLQVRPLRRPVFVDAAALGDLRPGVLRVAVVDGTAILLANVEGDVYAFRNGCPVDGLPLDDGHLSGTVLVCPWHNCAFDARTGRPVDRTGTPGLSVVPIAIEDGTVRVAVNVV